ncbi:uncharacterized protein LAESUDRAFT_721683 [Laetiporus sulphureus 93-53]|uniref:Uncharacterized protein n=1 Tax=Laetiporus sulphureus 93-53 TaxID=1314785 RepID=A0A165GH97_9APHY|nr:uncharacterized protein LAESUDRAFT_721683 [Laetiporus sulphureus 93-53]KZT10346.1 hypothetical protein LAESUDRAFT_721683 [Laetiporus sulphureus 93-53]
MSEYYRPSVPFPSVPSGHQLYNATVIPSSVANDVDDAHDPFDANGSSDTGQTRYCSVRGCGNELIPGYTGKMCEVCRGRHRIYASTKRAKRKMEKAAMGAQNGQPVVWMPSDDNVEDNEPVVEQTPASFVYASSTWDHSAIDPALFSSDSELANALLPVSPPRSKNPAQSGSSLHMSAMTLSSNPQSSSSISSMPTPMADHPVNTPHTPSSTGCRGSTSPPETEDSSLPPRYCSIKGCKALVPGNSFFKMCEPCRDRYRNYGTTKRAKWKREKEIAVAELHKMREEEDRRRIEAGLPPLSHPLADDWHEWNGVDEGQVHSPGALVPSTDGRSSVVTVLPRPPRMCTVSHCREILPGDYPYLRCERHRIQNRHHSKLKRVRDKEVKAQAFDGWTAYSSASRRATSEMSRDGEDGGDVEEADDEDANTMQIAGMGGVDTPFGEPSTGIPPAARGTRRTNHTCSIKSCYNLLSPSNPWKMCDSCRARDRQGRREKALRDSGIVVSPPPLSGKELVKVDAAGEADDGESAKKAVKKTKKKTKKKRVNGISEADGTVAGDMTIVSEMQASGIEQDAAAANAFLQAADHIADEIGKNALPSHVQPTLVFMQPMVQSSNLDTVPTSPLQAPAADLTQPSEASPPVRASADPFHLVSAEQIVNRTAQAEAVSTAGKKRTLRKKARKTAEGEAPTPHSAEASASTSPPSSELDANVASTSGVSIVVPEPQAMSNSVPPTGLTIQEIASIAVGTDVPPSSTPIAPPYMSFYMPPYGMPPYGAQPGPYSYGAPAYPYSHPAYAPSPMYQPPYYPAGYMYPQPYGTQAYVAAPPPVQAPAISAAPTHSSATAATSPPPPPPSQSVYSVSADFVSHPDYANIQQGISSYGEAGVLPLYGAFSAKTGEPNNRLTNTPSVLRRKRQADQEADGENAVSASMMEANKRPEMGAEPAAVFASADISDQSVVASVPANTDNRENVTDEAGILQSGIKLCGSKSCHRQLPSNASGSLCSRCRDRLKKKRVKVKQRFHLEPRSLLSRPQQYERPVNTHVESNATVFAI